MKQFLFVVGLTIMLAFQMTAQTTREVADKNKLTRIDHEIVINAPISRVWTALTTPDGLKGWIAPESKVELWPGGAYELYFWPKEKDRGMEGTKILNFIPGEMLSYTGEDPGTWVVWRLDSVAPEKTRVRFSGLGSGSAWEERYKYFDKATPEVLKRLSRSVAVPGA